MAGETRRLNVVKEVDAESKLQDGGTVLEQQSDRSKKESSEHFSSTGTDTRASSKTAKGEKVEKERDCPQQREAVIRPQQAGKIDFRSLQNRSKFPTDRTWSSGKGGPQSPKGRSREKAKRSGKAERGNPQQLYRLSITNPRTIGIAYPQQKVLPPKTLDPIRRPVSGTYRFNVPSIPEREVEQQQEELIYSRHFQEASSNLTSPSYTSQALSSPSGATSHLHPSLSQQLQPPSMENNGAQSGSQLTLTDYQLGGSNAWQSPERTLNGANYEVFLQKPTALSEASKTGAFIPSQFQYGYYLMEESTSDSFSLEQNQQSQDFSNSSHGSVHVTHNAQFGNHHQQKPDDQPSCPQPPLSQFIKVVPSSIPCPRNLSEDSTSSDSSGSSSLQSEQGKTLVSATQDGIGSVHARSVTHGSGSPIHFANKPFTNPPVNNIHTASMPFDKNINNNNLNRIQHVWEGHNKTYPPAEQNTFQYTDMNDKFMFQNQPALEQGPNSSKNSRMSWQHSQLNHNRVEFSRPINKQKLAYIIPPSDWQDDNKSNKINNHKTPGSFQNARTSNQRQESLKHSSNTVSTFKVEMSHAQVCEAKNKTVFFNQSVSTVPPRNYNYPPLQVPSMGLMMVSPYESPLPSPVHNPASSSTCSSLSPTSNSPVNSSSEESHMTKTTRLFYHQPQSKTQLPTDQLSTHTHQFHSDTARSLLYTQDRSKDDMMGYLQNNTPPKAAMGGMKGYMDSFGMEHHQPPPPYSAHQLLASSLATANLDQLDVLLTCKQCDQNFNNLASFLGHKQYCSQHTIAQNDLKGHSKIEDHRKCHTEPTKAVLAVSNASMSRCSSDLHLSLLGLNKNGELVSENETKGQAKEDQMKLGLFSGTNNLPVPLPELEMEDPKLDSLITEALNGLGYQSDNAEIDSSFIDAFVDDELSTVKSSSNKQCLKKKESMFFESKHKQTVDDRSFTSGKYFNDSDTENPEKMSLNSEQEKNKVKKEVTHKKSTIASREKIWQQGSKVKEARKLCKSEDGNTSTQRFILSSKFSERCGLKSFQENSVLRGSTPSQSSTSPTLRSAVKESKRKSTGGGTWSKELIHKIVQQKNKLNKLHVKGTKNLQFSLVMERLTPSVQNPAFGEYDYVSDTDDECEPVKIASQGRLNQSSRCKYTYTKECKWRARSERDQAAWRRESKECFEMKKSEEVCLSPEKPDSYLRIRRRGSRSSTSSEHSTSVSVSSDGLNSPKSTDSDCEKKTDIMKECPEQEHNDKSSSQTLFKQSSTLALTFTKSVKKCNSDKAILSENKSSVKDVTKYHSNTEFISLLSSSQKNKDCIKMEKGRSSQTKSRDKVLQKETNSVISSDKNRTDKLYQSEELGVNTRLQKLDSDSSSNTKETDFNIDRIPKSNEREGPEATQLELSDSSVFEQPTDSVHVLKENLSLVSDVDTHKPASLCTSLMDDVCLSPNESQSPLIQKDPLHLMPYPLDQEQTLIKSPLTFDTSSMFGELTGFDSGLYSEMPIQKASFNSMDNATDKKEEFVSSFSPFLEQRDWNLMVSPELPDEISQYKDNSEKANEKKQDYHHIPLSLPEKIIDYSANLTSCASEDELEIKRIVNELETQLQTTKLETPPLLTQDIHKNLQMSKFSPLRLGDESDNEGSGLNMKCPVQTMEVEDTNTPSECFPQPGLAWSSDFQFALMGEHHSAHTPIHNETEALEDITKNDAHAAKLIPTALHNEQQQAQISKNKTAEQQNIMETKEAMLEEKRYTENLIKSLEVISDSIFKKEPILSEHNSPCEDSLPNQQPRETECQASDSDNPSEKDRKENSLSPLSISEEKDKTEAILPYQADLTVRGCRPISPQPCETTENTAYMTGSQVLLGGKITTLLEFTDSSNVTTRKLHEVEDSCEKDTIKDKVNPLFKINHGGQENSTTDICVEEEDVKGQSTDQLSSLASDVSHLDVMKSALQTVDKDDNPEAGLLNNSCVDLLNEEISVKQSKQDNLHGLGFSNSFSHLDTFSETEMPVQIVNSVRPCSPTLIKADTECTSHDSPFQSPQPVVRGNNVLTLSHGESFIASDSNMNVSLTSEPNIVLDSIQNQKKVLKVQCLPVNFMASEQNSPSSEEEENQSVISEIASSSLLLSTSPTKSEQEKSDKKGEICSLQKSINKSSVQNEKDVQNETKDQNVKEASDGGEMMPTNKEPYSLISPPHLDLGALESSENIQTTISTTQPVNALDGLLKSNLMFDFKISTLNYTSVSDEPPQLHQYNYIPNSPPSKPEEYLNIKQRLENDCQPGDLNINPALIFEKPETDTTKSLNTHAAAKTYLTEEPGICQPSIKFSSFDFDIPDEFKTTRSVAAEEKAKLEVFQHPVKPVENLDLYANTMNKAENDPLGSQEVTNKDCLLLKKDFSNDSPTLKSLILCENDQPPPALKPSGNQPTIDTVQDSAAPQKVQSITQDGKVHCDICFMCFRTVPGLKRHKAMKHLVRAKKYTDPQSATISHQGSVPSHEAPQVTEKNPEDDPQTCYTAKTHELPDIGSALISKVASETKSVLKKMANQDAVATHVKDHQNFSQPEKTKKDNKARKNKNSEAIIKPDLFSDEHLNVIKTDILQAISPDFKSSVVQEHDKSQKAETKINDSATESTNYGLDSSSQCSLKEKHVPGNAVELPQETNTEDITVMADTEMSADHEVKVAVSINKERIRESDESGRRVCGVEKKCEQKEPQEGKAAADTKSEKCSDELATVPCLNSSPLSSPGISPDLNALLDDDTTFSQLFPRDEEAKRKKCSRVYSKRNKRQTLPAHGSGSPHYLPPETFEQNKDSRKESEQVVVYNQAKHSAYETISIDDAIMLNMCHNSSIEANIKLQSHYNQSDEKEKCGKTEEASNRVDKSLTEWRGTTDFFGFNDGSAVKSDPSNHKTEVSTTTICPPVPTVPHTTEPSPTESVQPFHSIDIQNINTTFQLPEIQFFDPNKDISVTPPVETVSPVQTNDDKSKKVTERRGRKRQDGVIKVKDKQYKCKVCFTWFLTLGELNFHKLSHNPSPPPTCYMCVQRKFSSREQLRDHLREKHAKNKTGIWTCGMCLKEISDVWMYNEHLREHATQFARRGQSQGSMMGIPGCFMQETAVKNFISSIMQQRPNKASKAAKTQEKNAETINREENNDQSKLHKTKNNGSSGKQSGLTPMEVLHKTGAPKSVEMHPNCKDPSRDCHHCGKQFPKPFKLQRHLVVHNLERIFLCHKCPVTYQEAQDLKDHLQRAHKEVEELDSKHTTLYTCELCADVMHVIKKSFICSTCNYTFSKKEQFDRHMEKHLSGGNKIFKFRGVLRPVKVSVSKENECDSPANKKRRICSNSLQENSSDSGIASVSSVHLNQNSDTPSSRPPLSTADDSTQTAANEYHSDTNNTNVKTEEMAEDYSELLVELDKCIHQNSSASKKEDSVPSLNLCREENGKLVSESYDVKTENDSVCIRVEPNSWSATKEKSNLGEQTCEAKIGPARDDASENETTTDSHSQHDNTPVSLGENQVVVESSQSEKQELNIQTIDQLRDVEPIPSVYSTVNKQQLLSHGAEQESSSHNDIVSSAQTNDIMKSSSTKATEPTSVFPPRGLASAAASAEDRETVKPQRKRKDMKPPHNTQRVSSPMTQENFDIDARASKKFRSNKYASSSLQRKSDGPNDYPVLSSVRDDVVSNKIVSKCKTINLDLQSKRSLLDNCTPKKTEVVTLQNGNYKTKKGALGRSLHSSLPKVPISHTFNKSRPKVGIRLMESHSYRTAESQNNLLSQLFGQKLTSFKIPLRKDTSESLN
uniref:C2H2-type domain-containing protein n=1 Tax=Gouania willdenowi TaxID=441366 RepID=A0A8C5HZ88_GOUWI